MYTDQAIGSLQISVNLWLVFPDLYPQLFELSLAHGRRRIHHQIHGPRRLGEWNYFAQAVSPRQDHHDPVEAERNPAVRRRAVFQRLKEKPEARSRFFFG